MADYRMRLTQTLEFDEKREADIIKQIEILRDQRNLGQFLSSAVRLAIAHPELLEYPLASYGLKDERSEFFASVQKEVREQAVQIDEVYEVARQTYELALLGKRMSLEGKAENSLRAAFILERQERDLSEKLGVSLTGHMFASSRMEDTRKRAEDVVECAITSYDSILQELKGSIQLEAVNVVQSVANPVEPAVAGVEPAPMPIVPPPSVTPLANQEPVITVPVIPDEVIDLGPPAVVAPPLVTEPSQDGDIVFGAGAGLDALARFLGN